MKIREVEVNRSKMASIAIRVDQTFYDWRRTATACAEVDYNEPVIFLLDGLNRVVDDASCKLRRRLMLQNGDLDYPLVC